MVPSANGGLSASDRFNHIEAELADFNHDCEVRRGDLYKEIAGMKGELTDHKIDTVKKFGEIRGDLKVQTTKLALILAAAMCAWQLLLMLLFKGK